MCIFRYTPRNCFIHICSAVYFYHPFLKRHFLRHPVHEEMDAYGHNLTLQEKWERKKHTHSLSLSAFRMLYLGILYACARNEGKYAYLHSVETDYGVHRGPSKWMQGSMSIQNAEVQRTHVRTLCTAHAIPVSLNKELGRDRVSWFSDPKQTDCTKP